jgi:hypothetical protein
MKMITNRIFLSSTKPAATKTASAEGQVKTASSQKQSNIANLGDYAHPSGKKKTTEVVEACDTDMEAKAKAPKKKEASAKVAEVKEEKVETYDAGKLEAKNFTNDAKKEPEDCEKPEKESGKAATTTTKTKDGTFPSSGQPQWEGEPKNNNKPEMPTDKNTQASANDLLKKILSSLDVKFEKFANLKPEIKKDFVEYWRSLYGADYAAAMAEDK